MTAALLRQIARGSPPSTTSTGSTGTTSSMLFEPLSRRQHLPQRQSNDRGRLTNYSALFDAGTGECAWRNQYHLRQGLRRPTTGWVQFWARVSDMECAQRCTEAGARVVACQRSRTWLQLYLGGERHLRRRQRQRCRVVSCKVRRL